ncbi:hypothetical protein ACHWQZ_G001076 [Mnemiopsis leidyi]
MAMAESMIVDSITIGAPAVIISGTARNRKVVKTIKNKRYKKTRSTPDPLTRNSQLWG